MRTVNYNPSTLEVDFAKALHALSPQLENKIDKAQVVGVKANHKIDNPQLTFRVKDAGGDLHEIVVQIIQRPDHIISK